MSHFALSSQSPSPSGSLALCASLPGLCAASLGRVRPCTISLGPCAASRGRVWLCTTSLGCVRPPRAARPSVCCSVWYQRGPDTSPDLLCPVGDSPSTKSVSPLSSPEAPHLRHLCRSCQGARTGLVSPPSLHRALKSRPRFPLGDRAGWGHPCVAAPGPVCSQGTGRAVVLASGSGPAVGPGTVTVGGPTGNCVGQYLCGFFPPSLCLWNI